MGIKTYFGKKKDGVVDTAKKTIGVEQIKANGEYIFDLGKQVFSVNKNEEKKEELTFEQVVEKYKLTTAQLQRQYRFQMINFYILATLFFLGFIYLFYSLGKANFLSAFSTLPFMMIAGGMALKSSVMCFRYKYKSFKTVSEWLNSGEYFPATWVDLTKKYEPKRRNKHVL